MIRSIEEIRTKYDTRSFKIMDYHGDNNFNVKTLETSLLPGLIHIYEKHEHIQIIEWSIYTIKDRSREKCHAEPLKRYTRPIKISLIEVVVDLLSRLPSKD